MSSGQGRNEVPAVAPHFLVDALPAAGPFLLHGPEGRHASIVRRIRVGEVLVLSDGAGRLAAAAATAVTRGGVDLQVGSGVEFAPPDLRITVVQALPKGERSELAVELATEAGADAVVPWSAARCIARWTGEKTDKGVQRWQQVAREAAKQSRRAFVPVVHPLANTSDITELIERSDAALVLHEAGSAPLAGLHLPATGSLLLVVGPEGGISPEELTAFRTAGAVVVRLGPEVLRTSTAAAVALGALGVLTSRWDSGARPARCAPGNDETTSDETTSGT